MHVHTQVEHKQQNMGRIRNNQAKHLLPLDIVAAQSYRNTEEEKKASRKRSRVTPKLPDYTPPPLKKTKNHVNIFTLLYTFSFL